MRIKALCEYCGGPITESQSSLSLQTFSDFSAALAGRPITGKSTQGEYSQSSRKTEKWKKYAGKPLR
jgi:hypothetical protein